MSFVHLRVHSEYSFLRGACRLEALLARTRELGMPALALTDYGVLHGAVRFTELAHKYGIQPILGVEFGLPCGLPLVLLVRDRIGWQNLLRLVNGYRLGHPKKTLNPVEISQFSTGLFAILHTRGEGLMLPEDSTVQLVKNQLESLLPFFGDHLYLGLEDAGLPGTARLNRHLAHAATMKSVPLLATHNVHYVLPGDDTAYRMVNCIRTATPLAGAWQSFLHGAAYELKTPAEMALSFAAFDGAYENTLHLAGQCTFTLRREGMNLPAYELSGGETAEAALRRLCEDGMKRHGVNND